MHLVGQLGWDVDRGSGDADVLVPVGDAVVMTAETVGHLPGKAGENVNVEKVKSHIHRELFGDRFPTTISIMEWKDQHKKTVMRRSVQVMRSHNQSNQEIVQMLEDKFFLTEQQAGEFMENERIHEEESKKSCQ